MPNIFATGPDDPDLILGLSLDGYNNLIQVKLSVSIYTKDAPSVLNCMVVLLKLFKHMLLHYIPLKP